MGPERELGGEGLERARKELDKEPKGWMGNRMESSVRVNATGAPVRVNATECCI